MKILQLTNKPPYPDKDGGAIATLNLTQGLSRLGHVITVLSMNTLKHHTRLADIPPRVSEMADFRFVEVPAPINTTGAAWNFLFSSLPYNAARFISENYSQALISLLQEKKFDIIQLEGLYLCPYIPVIRQYSQAKIVYRAHNVEFEIWERSVSMAKGLRKMYLRNLAARIRHFEISWLNQYDLLVPITDRDALKLKTMGNTQPVHVCMAGIDTTNLVADRANLEYPSVFHLGSLEWSPNQEGLLWFLNQCWPELHREFPGLKFYVAGRNAPKWLIQKMNQPGVIFEGEVPDAYLYMNSRAIMVVPLLSGSGMRIKIIEGMALGKAIVSTTIGAEGLGTTCGKNILIADNPESFVEEIRKLVTQRGLFDSLGRESMLFIQENFDNLALTGRLAGFYQRNLT